MLAARLHGKEDLKIEEIETPTPSAGEVLVRVRTATTCGTDLKVYRRGGHAKMIRLPALFGHEGSGEVAALGKGASGFSEGDRVVWNNSAPCGSCFYCEAGESSLCKDLLFLNGTYAEYVLVPKRIVEKNLLKVPESLSFDLAAMTEPLACVLHGAEKIDLRRARTAVLLGDGAIGLFFVALAKELGVRLFVVGGSEQRLAMAMGLGAAGALSRHVGRDPNAWLADEMGTAVGPDVVIEAVGRPDAWEDAAQMVRPGGRVLLFGGCARDTTASFSTERLHYDAITLQGVFHNTPREVRQALDLLTGETGRALSALLCDPAPLGELVPSLERMARREVFKVPIHP